MVARDKLLSISIYLTFILVSIVLLLGKKDFHIDELFSYGLSNNVESITMPPPEEGRLFEPTKEAYYDYLVADPNSLFNYKQVWINQELDVHPPLYYAILHTISSFFPGEFSIWFAGSINVAALLLTLFLARKILALLEVPLIEKNMISGIFVFSAGIWSSLCFLRMYALTMFWVTLTTYIFLLSLKKNIVSYKMFLCMLILAVLGTLTHYYYLIYLFFICIVYFIYLALYWPKKIIPFVAAYLSAAAITIKIFPPILFHIFEDDRGEESINNLKAFTFSEYIEKCKKFKDMINTQLFRGYLEEIVLLIILTIILADLWKKRKKIKDIHHIWEWLLMAVPTGCYVLLVAQIAVYQDIRYMFPVFSLIIILLFRLLFCQIKKIGIREYHRAIICFIGFGIIFSTIQKSNPTFRNMSKDLQKVIKEYHDRDCIYIHDRSWRIQASFNEIKGYHSVRFFSEEYFYDYDQPDTVKDQLVVSIVKECNIEKVIEKILENYTGVSEYKKIASFGYSDTYYFYNPDSMK